MTLTTHVFVLSNKSFCFHMPTSGRGFTLQATYQSHTRRQLILYTNLNYIHATGRQEGMILKRLCTL
jgi:hypothetical protein